MGCFAGLFGAQSSTTDIDKVNNENFNAQRKVFPTEEWAKLVTCIKAREAAGEPLVYKVNIPVLENKLIAVRGGYTCTLIVFVSGQCEAFTSALPKEVAEKIKSDTASLTSITSDLIAAGIEEANLANFPYIPTGNLRYSKVLVALLAQLANWQVMTAQKMGLFEDL